MPGSCFLILDDGKARRFAKKIGLTITGTLGLLITAHEAGILPDIKVLVAELQKANFRLPTDAASYTQAQ
jgi:predicted nucleic acid-binding protein